MGFLDTTAISHEEIKCWCSPEKLCELPNGIEIWVHKNTNGLLPPAKFIQKVIEVALQIKDTKD